MVFGLGRCAAPSVRIFTIKKNHDFGQETVKFWMLYQPLTSIGPAPGKEKENQAGREIGCPPLTDTEGHRGRQVGGDLSGGHALRCAIRQ
jgi:hypothetical protein